MNTRKFLLAAFALAALGGCATRGGYGIDTRVGLAEAAEADDSLAAASDERGTYLALIRRMQGDGLHYASLAHVDAYVARFGSTADVELLRCDALRGTAQYAQAEAGYRRLIQLRSAAPAAWHGLGLLVGRRGDYAAAAALFAEAVKRAPTTVDFLNDYGYASLRAGSRDAARVAIAQAAELDPANQKALGNLAVFLYSGGDRNGAEALMEQAGMSAATRNAVRELASQIRPLAAPPAAAATTPQPIAHVAPAAAAPTAVAPNGVNPNRDENFAIKSMLDRFNGG